MDLSGLKTVKNVKKEEKISYTRSRIAAIQDPNLPGTPPGYYKPAIRAASSPCGSRVVAWDCMRWQESPQLYAKHQVTLTKTPLHLASPTQCHGALPRTGLANNSPYFPDSLPQTPISPWHSITQGPRQQGFPEFLLREDGLGHKPRTPALECASCHPHIPCTYIHGRCNQARQHGFDGLSVTARAEQCHLGCFRQSSAPPNPSEPLLFLSVMVHQLLETFRHQQTCYRTCLGSFAWE